MSKVPSAPGSPANQGLIRYAAARRLARYFCSFACLAFDVVSLSVSPPTISGAVPPFVHPPLPQPDRLSNTDIRSITDPAPPSGPGVALPQKAARLRLGYRKSKTGCLRCKARRVKVGTQSPFHHPLTLCSVMRIGRVVRASDMEPTAASYPT